MINLTRAGGIAGAVFALAVTVTFSDPLNATQTAAGPPQASYLDHATATIEAEGAALNEVGAIAQNVIKAADAIVPRPRALPELVEAYAAAEVPTSEQDCLASAVYFEARGEPIEGQLAVAEVVLNRVASKKYPDSICEVVTQPWQFSFVNSTGRIPAANRASEAWKKAVAISEIALKQMSGRVSEDVLWYHADYVAPSWGRRLDKETKIGLHIFYS